MGTGEQIWNHYNKALTREQSLINYRGIEDKFIIEVWMMDRQNTEEFHFKGTWFPKLHKWSPPNFLTLPYAIIIFKKTCSQQRIMCTHGSSSTHGSNSCWESVQAVDRSWENLRDQWGKEWERRGRENLTAWLTSNQSVYLYRTQ